MKKTVAFILAIVMALALVACTAAAPQSAPDAAAAAPAAANEPADASEPADAQKEPVKLTFWANTWITEEQQVQQAVVDQWNAEHPEIQVELVLVGWQSCAERLLTAFETGDTPDMFHFDQTDIADWQELGYLADLNAMLTDEERADVNEDVWNGLTNSKGEILALPTQYETQVIYYNADMFAAAGIEAPTFENPWTFEQFCDAARKLTDPAAGVYGVDIPSLQGFGRSYSEVWGTMAGDPLVYETENGGHHLEVGAKGLEVIGTLKALLDEGTISPASLTGTNDYIGEFLQGKYAMVVGRGCFDRSNFINGSVGLDNVVNWKVCPPIKIESSNVYGFVQTISVCANSQHQQEAFEFLHFYWNTENTMKIAKAAYIMPGRNSSVASDELNTEENDWALCQKLAAANNVVPSYVWLPGWGQITNARGIKIWGDYFAGLLTLEQASAQWTTEADALFAQYAE